MSEFNAFRAELTLNNGMVAVLNMKSKILYERMFGHPITVDIAKIDVLHPSQMLLCQMLHAFLLVHNPNITEDEVIAIFEEQEDAPLSIIGMGFQNVMGDQGAVEEPVAEPTKPKTTRAKKKPIT